MPPVNIAMAYVGLGETDEAFRWLERAFSERAAWLPNALTSQPAFQPLRTDPRFTDLLQRIGLSPPPRAAR